MQTITEVTRAFGVSTRMLRYYEQIGLLASRRISNYAYRVYDAEACARLRQIIILRKLRIPLKQIGVLLSDEVAVNAVEIFLQNISELDEEITSLSTIRNILRRFVERLRENASIQIDLLDGENLPDMIVPLTLSKFNFKEEKSMIELNKASERLERLTDKDVRIVYLPPAYVAAYQYEGDEPERVVGEVVDNFVRTSGLLKVHPGLRHLGFNAPNPVDGSGAHGYEMWVTVPGDFKIPEPLTRKYFEGGMYAAHMIPFGAFEEWGLLDHWVNNNDKYEYRGGGSPGNMFDSLEESLNYYNRINLPSPGGDGLQLDLLIPVKEKK